MTSTSPVGSFDVQRMPWRQDNKSGSSRNSGAEQPGTTTKQQQQQPPLKKAKSNGDAYAIPLQRPPKKTKTSDKAEQVKAGRVKEVNNGKPDTNDKADTSRGRDQASDTPPNPKGSNADPPASATGNAPPQPPPPPPPFDLFRLVGPWIASTASKAFQEFGSNRGSAYVWRRWLSGGGKEKEKGEWTEVRKGRPMSYRQAEIKVLREASLPSEDAEVDAAVSAPIDIWELPLNKRLELAVSWMRGLRSE